MSDNLIVTGFELIDREITRFLMALLGECFDLNRLACMGRIVPSPEIT